MIKRANLQGIFDKRVEVCWTDSEDHQDVCCPFLAPEDLAGSEVYVCQMRFYGDVPIHMYGDVEEDEEQQHTEWVRIPEGCPLPDAEPEVKE